MAKQTVGTATHNIRDRCENKLWRLQTPTSPFLRTEQYDNTEMDNYPSGVNAVVAMVSYTGYDMEDAMIINKASAERGLAYATLYKTTFIDLKEEVGGSSSGARCFTFKRNPDDPQLASYLDEDGLPYLGLKLEEFTPYAWYAQTLNPPITIKPVSIVVYYPKIYKDVRKILNRDVTRSNFLYITKNTIAPLAII